MKRSLKTLLIAVAFAVITLFNLTSCALTDAFTAYGLYSSAAKKLVNAGGFDADCVLTMSINIFGSDLDKSVSMNIKQKGKDSQITTKAGETDIITTQIGDSIYVETGKIGVKYRAPEGNSNNSGSSDSDSSGYAGKIIPKLPKVLFDGIEIIKGEEGRKSITINLDDETASALFNEFLNTESLHITVGETVLTMNFDKKRDLESMQVNCDVALTVIGMTLNGEITVDYTFNNFGIAPDFTQSFPEEEYEDGGVYQGNDMSIFDWAE